MYASDFAVAKTGVYWDIEDCPIPENLSPKMIYKNIKAALADMGYKNIYRNFLVHGIHERLLGTTYKPPKRWSSLEVPFGPNVRSSYWCKVRQ
ncbi:unnamed protein product [Microthlaspi erraticum]|uniref:NYN domain-containing protein n=1 Tax=Microthlaspi erraticum TaxID=1685480 RepID=A0A6D2HRB8_9BRAS|nr:unnamed protein product [Microthlaspi erraticum]